MAGGTTLGDFSTVSWSVLSDRTMWEANWTFAGTANYDEDGYIKVDKGSPDEGKWVIFYAVNKKDPMIFVNSEKELKKEVQTLLKRSDVDPKSIRIFGLVGGAKEV